MSSVITMLSKDYFMKKEKNASFLEAYVQKNISYIPWLIFLLCQYILLIKIHIYNYLENWIVKSDNTTESRRRRENTHIIRKMDATNTLCSPTMLFTIFVKFLLFLCHLFFKNLFSCIIFVAHCLTRLLRSFEASIKYFIFPVSSYRYL